MASQAIITEQKAAFTCDSQSARDERIEYFRSTFFAVL
jgi:hypothetical protein